MPYTLQYCLVCDDLSFNWFKSLVTLSAPIRSAKIRICKLSKKIKTKALPARIIIPIEPCTPMKDKQSAISRENGYVTSVRYRTAEESGSVHFRVTLRTVIIVRQFGSGYNSRTPNVATTIGNTRRRRVRL